jgi:DNA recombination protein RmuC
MGITTGILIVIGAINLILLTVLLSRRNPVNELKSNLDQLEKSVERTERLLREEIAANRGEQLQGLQGFSTILTTQMNSLMQMNEQKLEKMRETVDEKLQSTLEKRLGESFRMVSDRLEKVHQGLGEMQSLAIGVGDLKKVLSNVK